jgi:maltose alpha-D-glucosyltransferase/alpha-amylase
VAHSAFISYAREDAEFALRLAEDLKDAGAAAWLDQLDILPGDLWDIAVERALKDCPRMLVILSPASVTSTNVLDEVSYALQKKKTVIPLLYRDAEIPFRLHRIQHIDFRSDYARRLKTLLKVLITAISLAPPATEPTVEDGNPPPDYLLDLENIGGKDILENLEGEDIEDVLTGPGLERLELLLTSYLPRKRWFGAKSRTIKAVKVLDSTKFPAVNAALLFLQVAYEDGSADVYLLALAIVAAEEDAKIMAADPTVIVAVVNTSADPASLCDAVGLEAVRQAILNLIETNGELRTQAGVLRGRRSSAFAANRGVDPLPARTGSAEQSNTSILYGDKLILKLFRRLQPGENPDTEIGRFLTETAHFTQIAPFLGDITLTPESGEPTTVAMLQGLVKNDGDGWQWTLGQLSRFYESVADLPTPDDLGSRASFLASPEPPALAREHAGPYLDAAGLLGRRTAEMHLALATPTENPAFAAEPFTTEHLCADASRIDTQLSHSLDALQSGLSRLTGVAADSAARVLAWRADLSSRARAIASATSTGFGQRIRIHGDYHLGQVLRSRGDFVILDFEGEPAKSLTERRAKQSPLRDVAGMLRSFSYAAYAALNAFTKQPPDKAENLDGWATLWQNAVSTEFLRAYRLTIDSKNPHLIPQPEQAQRMLNAYVLEKALYELLYELDNRPTWVRIPLAGMLALPQ